MTKTQQVLDAIHSDRSWDRLFHSKGNIAVWVADELLLYPDETIVNLAEGAMDNMRSLENEIK